jgi:hypothetical protein
MVKAKGNVNTPMAQVVEVALEEVPYQKGLKETFLRKGSSGTRE